MELLALPPELRCQIITEGSFSIDEVREASLVSKELRNDLHSCITSFQKQTKEPNYILDPRYVMIYPRLKRSTYPIKITSPADLQLIASHKHLKQAIFDLNPLYDRMKEMLNLAIIEERDDPPEEFSRYRGFDVNSNRKGVIHTVTLTSIEDMIVFFLLEYAWFHRSKSSLVGTSFTFTTDLFAITIEPGSICVLDQPGFSEISDRLLDLNDLARELNRRTIFPLTKYAGPWPVPKPVIDPDFPNIIPASIRWEDVCISLRYTSLLLSYEEESYFIDEEGLDEIDTFLLTPSLRHFGIFPADEASSEALFYWQPIPHWIGRLRFPNLEIFDYPVSREQLYDLKAIMPNLKEPLLLSESNPSTNLEILKVYPKYRIVPIPGSKLGPNMRIDSDNYFWKFPC